MDDKESLLKNPKEEKVDRKIEEMQEKIKEEHNSNLDLNSKIIIGTLQEAPKFLKNNEYIINGYIINCNTFKNALRCLFKYHNETVNTWSHLLGSIFFLFLIFYTIFFITNFDIQLNFIKKDTLPTIEQKAFYLYELSPGELHNFYESVKNIQNHFNNYNQKIIYNETINNIFSLYNEIAIYIKNKITSIINHIKSLLDSLSLLKKESVDLINLDKDRTQTLESYLETEVKIQLKERAKKELTRFPLFIMIISAILCLFFSASYHALKIISEVFNNISHRFDHGGISLLISGSCFPPYYYFFYYENKYKYFYLILISALGLGIFLYSILSSDFSKPYKRTFRGILFLLFGICTGIPIVHMTFFGDSINGYCPGIKLRNWYYGGFSYIFGALLYILRFPEKKFKGKFDYFGSSHQIFHILVFSGATFHYFGSLDAYNYRFKYMDF